MAKESALYPQEQLARVKKSNESFTVGVPKEISFQEARVTLTPESVGLLSANGHEIWVQTGAGKKSSFSDHDYSEAGAIIVQSAEEVYKANIILKIEPPTLEEIELFTPGKMLISAIQLANLNEDYIKALLAKRITAVGYELIEDKVGGYPIIRAMSEIAGSVVVQIAAEYLSNVHDGKGIILGGITGVTPTKVVILGAGTVAEYAARTALGMGANIQIFDNHIYKLRRIKHALGIQINTSTIDSSTLATSIREADVVIGAIRSERGGNRIIVSEEMVMEMKPGSVIIDLSIDHGGCVETSEVTTHDNPIFVRHEVIHYCVPNITSRVSRTASLALSKIFTPTILRSGEEGSIEDMVFSHKWFMKGVYTYKGSLTNYDMATTLGLKCKDLNLLRAVRM